MSKMGINDLSIVHERVSQRNATVRSYIWKGESNAED